ncbi:hypothetical protein [Lutibacter sp.]|uniref:tetratricopeptide repeat-containing sensor histidine kinase n=1 Tax=Lutibacter sp. TaxID=1925666 RepID=UPI00356208AC
MKNLKIVFLFFLIFSLFQLESCKRQEKIETSQKAKIDSVSYYVQQMKDRTLSDSICLIQANLGLNHAIKIQSNYKIVKEILTYKTYLFGNLKQLDSAISISKKLVNLSLKENDSIAIVNHYATLAYYYSADLKKDSAYLFYNYANEINLKLGDSSEIGKNLAQIAILLSDLGDFEESDNNAIEALKYLNDKNIPYLTAVYNCIAINSRKQKDYTEAIYWYNKAINISTKNTDKIKCLQNKSNAYRDLGKYDKSIAILDSLSKVPIESNATKARIIDNLAYTRWLNNEQNEDSSGMDNALNIRLMENDIWGLIASYAHLSEFYKKGNTKLSLVYASKMYHLASIQRSPHDQLEALQKLINLDDSPKVKEYYASYIHISDSLNEAEKSAKNKFAKLKYDSKKNRQENLELKVVHSEKELELEKERTTNIIGAVSSGSLVFALLVFGYFKTQKHKQEKRAEIYKTETRIAKKIHDEVANNVVNIMNKVQYAEEPKEVLLDDLEKVYLLTRNISHQNNTIETGEKFEASLKILLTSFTNDTTTIILKNIHEVKLENITKNKQIEIYRVLQELMVNMQKHSEASLVAISFNNTKSQYFINYSDNGVGIKFETLVLENGLKNVETRIKSINGIINFESSLNKGFKVFISFKK